MAFKPIKTNSRTDTTGCVLKKMVVDKVDVRKIGSWAWGMYTYVEINWDNLDYREKFYDIAAMDCEECCGGNELTYEEIDKFADELILSEESIPDGYVPEYGYGEMDFGAELKRRVVRKDSIESLAQWAFEIFMVMDCEYIDGMKDLNLRNALLNLAAMTEGKEFEMSYKELDKLADDMILEKEIKLK